MMISFRPLLALATSLALVASPGFAQHEPPQKLLRYAFRIAETGFDPASITDLYSRTVAAAIFDAPLEFEFLA
ncbi:MAG TPA: bicyclomycin resistance protein, partial [Burkholderiaceae bacterium]|nr:bicyclomycin resistance protein [Burkholderiaceae bacterium]